MQFDDTEIIGDTEFKIINEKYKELISPLFENRDLVAYANPNQFVRCVAGMSMEKRKALCHPYPNTMDKIEKYGYDGKQLSHCRRLLNFLSRYVSIAIGSRPSSQSSEFSSLIREM